LTGAQVLAGFPIDGSDPRNDTTQHETVGSFRVNSWIVFDARYASIDLARSSTAPILKAQEFNKAFVLMQYFGYLQRNPDDAPDANLNGYNFWLTKLNQFNGNFRQAEMVKAFITSGEYRSRFGPP
jgi:hypothetical protein